MAFLGEAGKIMALSRRRVPAITTSPSQLTAQVVGDAGEATVFTFVFVPTVGNISAALEVITVAVTFIATGAPCRCGARHNLLQDAAALIIPGRFPIIFHHLAVHYRAASSTYICADVD